MTASARAARPAATSAAEENRGALWRFKPRQNPLVNDYWICDEGRYSYKAANDPNLLAAMYVRKNGDLQPVAIDEAARSASIRASRRSAEAGGIVAGVLSPFLTVEEAYLLASYLKGLNPANVLALGPVPSSGTDQTFQPDQTKGRTGDTSFVVPRPFTIHAEKCPNRRGVSAVLEHFEGKVIGYDELVETGRDRRVSRALSSPRTRSTPGSRKPRARPCDRRVKFLVVQDTNVTPLAHRADVVLAGATFAEKAGCYVNADGRLQYSEAALPPRDGSLPDLDLLAILLNRPGGARSIRARSWPSWPSGYPAFAVAKGGKLPAHGVVLGSRQRRPTAVAGAPSFTDTWFLAHGAARAWTIEPQSAESHEQQFRVIK